MQRVKRLPKFDLVLFLGIVFLISISLITLKSISPTLFPLYFLYVFFAFLAYFIFLQIDFEVISFFATPLYIGSIAFLILPLLVGEVTRGAIRWIPLGALTIQPAEVVRPFLLLFFSVYLTKGLLTFKRFLKSVFLLALPIYLILVQPSLGMALLTLFGFIGVLLASDFNKKYLLTGVGLFLILIPVAWNLLAPYQRLRIISFLDPSSDPLGGGYNSIQSMISVGSGEITGRGLGRGVQTQLSFLPERQTDFIFAAVAEELGFVGAILLAVASFFLLWRLTIILESSEAAGGRAFVSGLFLTLFVQTLIHIGMNMGLLPITGVPLPLVSAGGSSLLGTTIGLAIATAAKKR